MQEQFTEDDFTKFNDIFKIRITEITLRELLLVQSIYVSKHSGGVHALVMSQPDPRLFMKVFLELNVKSLVSYLAFDYHAMAALLSEQNHEYFSDEFPIFYKNEKGESAIDVALGKNQIRSVNEMIMYICKFQNSWVYSNLFQHNLVALISKGV